MGWANKIIGWASGNGAEVDANNQLKVVLSNLAAQMGGVRLFSENDPGDIVGAPYLKSPETSTDYRLRVGLDTIWDTEDFNYVAQNSSKHLYRNTTMTLTWAANALNTNGAGITTTTTGASLQTYRHFPLYGAAPLYVEAAAAFTAPPTVNSTIDFGLMLLNAANPYNPTDGVYFRLASGGWKVVSNFNGTETVQAISFTHALNQVYKFNITISENEIEFWIDDVLHYEMPRGASNGAPSLSGSLPFGIRHAIAGGAAGGVLSGKFFNYTVTGGDITHSRLWHTVMTGMGGASVQGQSGHTQGQTANYANSAAPASATLSNTAAGYTTLGGQFPFAAVAGAETDYALFGFQVPAPTVNITGKNLIIRGVWIDSFNMGAAVATTPTLMQWALSVGATAVSLATAEAATTRAPRRIPLGSQSFPVGAAVGADSGKRIDVNLDAPLVCEPGSFVHVILKMPVGTATASQIIRGIVGINAYWE